MLSTAYVSLSESHSAICSRVSSQHKPSRLSFLPVPVSLVKTTQDNQKKPKKPKQTKLYRSTKAWGRGRRCFGKGWRVSVALQFLKLVRRVFSTLGSPTLLILCWYLTKGNIFVHDCGSLEPKELLSIFNEVA